LIPSDIPESETICVTEGINDEVVDVVVCVCDVVAMDEVVVVSVPTTAAFGFAEVMAAICDRSERLKTIWTIGPTISKSSIVEVAPPESTYVVGRATWDDVMLVP
jgi:hypothetical protein